MKDTRDDSLPASGDQAASKTLQYKKSDDFWELEAAQCSAAFQYEEGYIKKGRPEECEFAIGYRRCFDFDATDGRGQDAVILRTADDLIVGVVTDGVSQSFFGDIAAATVASGIVEELWRHREAPPSPQVFRKALAELQPRATMQVNAHQLSRNLPDMQKEVLERARTRGSQTVFAAFAFYPRTRLMALYQVGDIAVSVFPPESAPACDPRGRWSSTGMSDLMLATATINGCEEILLKSDGAAETWGKGPIFDRVGFVKMAKEQAAKDDVSFLRLRFPSQGEAQPLNIQPRRQISGYQEIAKEPPTTAPKRIDVLARGKAASGNEQMQLQPRPAEATAPRMQAQRPGYSSSIESGPRRRLTRWWYIPLLAAMALVAACFYLTSRSDGIPNAPVETQTKVPKKKDLDITLVSGIIHGGPCSTDTMIGNVGRSPDTAFLVVSAPSLDAKTLRVQVGDDGWYPIEGFPSFESGESSTETSSWLVSVPQAQSAKVVRFRAVARGSSMERAVLVNAGSCFLLTLEKESEE